MRDSSGDKHNAIRLRTTAKRLSKTYPTLTLLPIWYEPFDIVRGLEMLSYLPSGYVDTSTLIVCSSQPSKILGNFLDIRNGFTVKDPAFMHEAEWRLITPFVHESMFPSSMHSERKPTHYSGDAQLLAVPFRELRDFITGITVGPRASSELERQVERLCKSLHIFYEGKSQLRTGRFND